MKKTILIFVFAILVNSNNAYCQISPPELKRTYYDNGNIKTEETYRRGLRNGIYKEYHEDGRIKVIANYRNNNLVSKDEYNTRPELIEKEEEFKDQKEIPQGAGQEVVEENIVREESPGGDGAEEGNDGDLEGTVDPKKDIQESKEEKVEEKGSEKTAKRKKYRRKKYDEEFVYDKKKRKHDSKYEEENVIKKLNIGKKKSVYGKKSIKKYGLTSGEDSNIYKRKNRKFKNKKMEKYKKTKFKNTKPEGVY